MSEKKVGGQALDPEVFMVGAGDNVRSTGAVQNGLIRTRFQWWSTGHCNSQLLVWQGEALRRLPKTVSK